MIIAVYDTQLDTIRDEQIEVNDDATQQEIAEYKKSLAKEFALYWREVESDELEIDFYTSSRAQTMSFDEYQKQDLSYAQSNPEE